MFDILYFKYVILKFLNFDIYIYLNSTTSKVS